MRLYFVAKAGTGATGSPADQVRPNLPPVASYNVIGEASPTAFLCAIARQLTASARVRAPDIDELIAFCRARRIPFRALMERWKTADDAEADDGT